ncbi:MAG: hypothetical protein ABIJ56_03965 [Pseudomonadota bacterium]
MRKTAIILAYCLAAAFLFAAPGARAQGGKKLIIFDFDGKGSGAARDKLVKSLIGEGYGITPRKEAKATATDMGYASTPTEAGGMLAIAKALSVDAFVYGKVKAKGKRRELSLTVAATCEDGIVHNLEYEWTGKQMPPDTLALAVSQIIEEIGSAQKSCWAPPPPVPGDEAEEEVEAPKKKGGKATLILEGPPEKYCGKMGGIRCGLPLAISAHVRGQLTSRNMEVQSVNPSIKYKYEGSWYFMMGLDAELNIPRLFIQNPLFSAALFFNFAHSIALVSHPIDGTSTRDIPTKDMRVNIGLALEIAPKPGTLPLWIFIDLGWGMHTFAVDFQAGENEYISDFSYGYIPIGLGLRYSIVKRWLDVKFRLGINIPYSLGDAETFYGAEASGKIGLAMPGIWLDGVIAYGLKWAVGFEYIYFKGDFKGDGTITNAGHDSGKSFTDKYPTIYFMLGYRM